MALRVMMMLMSVSAVPLIKELALNWCNFSTETDFTSSAISTKLNQFFSFSLGSKFKEDIHVSQNLIPKHCSEFFEFPPVYPTTLHRRFMEFFDSSQNKAALFFVGALNQCVFNLQGSRVAEISSLTILQIHLEILPTASLSVSRNTSRPVSDLLRRKRPWLWLGFSCG